MGLFTKEHKAEPERIVVDLTIRCMVCGERFNVNTWHHYIAQDGEWIYMADTVFRPFEKKQYDAYDCPVCHRQTIVGARKQQISRKEDK